jgi:hypothetical protein
MRTKKKLAPWLSMFPNATSIDAPKRCREAPSDGVAFNATTK